MKMSGWGRYPVLDCAVTRPETEADLAAALAGGPVIARGNGRAYGDSAMNTRATLDMRRFSHMLEFDAATGVLVAEAGVILGDIIAAFLPRGWFPPVTPGTKFVTLGGMIAADVHGKNHHRDGSFGNFVDWIDVMGADGRVRRASRDKQKTLFEWTIGGMGLTGIILRAAIRLRPVDTGWIRQTTVATATLSETLAAFARADDATYSVAWIDCLARGDMLGRGLLMLGEHAGIGDLDARRRISPLATGPRRKKSVPFDLPGIALNPLVMRGFNTAYWKNGARKAGSETYIGWDSYFYPLDAVLGWNRIYGRKGFVQFQCVLPPDQAASGLRAILAATSAAGQGSFLAVLKRFGPQESRFSFPMQGDTLALDFPATPRALALLGRLDRIVLDHGGRFYLAKDARMPRDVFAASEPRAAAFARARAKTGAGAGFASVQSERLGM